MPTYGYRCGTCGHEFDAVQRMSDEPVAECPTCGAKGRRLFFPAGIVFKGSGFYATDNRARSSGGQATKDGSASGAGKTEKTEKTDNTEKKDKKTETKAESVPSSPAPSGDGAAAGSTG